MQTAIEFRVADRVREEIEILVPRLSATDFDWEDLNGACGIASLVLSMVYERLGIPHRFVMGWFRDGREDLETQQENHCWVELEGHDLIVDVTATQFGAAERVWIGPTTDVRYEVSLWDSVAVGELAYWGGQGHWRYESELIDLAERIAEEFRRENLEVAA